MALGRKEVNPQLALLEFSLQRCSKLPQPGTAIEDEHIGTGSTHLDARRIAAVPHGLGLRCGRRAAHAPEFDPQPRRLMIQVHIIRQERCGHSDARLEVCSLPTMPGWSTIDADGFESGGRYWA